MSVARDVIKMGQKALWTKDEDDILNAVEFGIILETRCNYFATLEGIVISHGVMNELASLKHVGPFLKWCWLLSEILFNFIDDILVLSFALLSFS